MLAVADTMEEDREALPLKGSWAPQGCWDLIGKHVSHGNLLSGKMNVPAVRTTSVVSIAVCDTLVAPFLANEKGKGLRVLGDIGRDSVGANAGIREVIRAAGVARSGLGGNAGLLQADEGALCLVLLAPIF